MSVEEKLARQFIRQQTDDNPRLYKAFAMAHPFMQAQREITSKIKEDNLDPMQAIMMVAMLANCIMAGDNVGIEEEVWRNLTYGLLDMWKWGLFVPSDDYPFTYEETYKAAYKDKDKEEVEEGA
jgi:hypothetical protein